MALTLLEAAVENGVSGMQAATIKMFAQKSSAFELMPFTKIDGRTYEYDRETALPGIGWRAVNEPWTESTGTINPLVERLMILGGEVKIDRFLLRTQPSQSQDLKRRQFEMKAVAAANEFTRAFLEGDDTTDPRQLVGLRRRLTGTQVLYFGSTGAGAVLTLDQLDQLLDLVPFEPKVLWMNRTLRRSITKLIRAQTGIYRVDTTFDAFGKQVDTYNGARIAIVETSGDASTYLDLDEDAGNGTATSASIYCTAFGEGLVHGIYNNGPDGMLVNVEDFGELEAEPRVLGRLEGYYGLAVEHPRAAARLRGVLAA